MGDEIVELDGDFGVFESVVGKLSSSEGVKIAWLEDELVPVGDEEMREGLIRAVAAARAEGWIPKVDPGCECLVCRGLRSYLSDGPA